MQGDQGSILLQRPAHNVPPNVSVACLDNVLDSLFSQVTPVLRLAVRCSLRARFP